MTSIEENYLKVKNTISENVTLVAVSKFHPLESILSVYDCGQKIFAESRPQELYKKVCKLKDMGKGEDISWHFIGHLQTNKLKFVLPYVDLIHSVDSPHLLTEMEKWLSCYMPDRKVNVLLEYLVSEDGSKQGFKKEEILNILHYPKFIYPHINFVGLMSMASFTDDENHIRKDFQKLVDLNILLQKLNYPKRNQLFRHLSFGMSSDYKIAMEMGSTMVRIGTSIFGEREY